MPEMVRYSKLSVFVTVTVVQKTSWAMILGVRRHSSDVSRRNGSNDTSKRLKLWRLREQSFTYTIAILKCTDVKPWYLSPTRVFRGVQPKR